jgi:hypothetical protein
VITVAVIAGLFGMWFWTVLNDETGIAKPVHNLLLKRDVTKKWMICPWCSGAWLAIIPSLLLFHDDLIPAVVTAFAAAAITGMLGSYFQGD